MNETQTEIIEVPVNSNSGCWKYSCGTLVSIVILASLFCGGTILFTGSTLSQFLDNVANLFRGTPSSAQVVTQRTLINSIQPLGQLVTIRTEIAKADILVQVDSGRLNLCGHSAEHVAEGVIEAGIDFTSITTDNIQYDAGSNTYTIHMPLPQLTSCRIEYIRQYDTQSNLGCSINWDNVRLLAQYVATNEFVEDALSNGILDRAQRENTLLMQSFVSALTSAKTQIIYDEPDTDAIILPKSCQPDVPQNWHFDEEIQKWVEGTG